MPTDTNLRLADSWILISAGMAADGCHQHSGRCVPEKTREVIPHIAPSLRGVSEITGGEIFVRRAAEAFGIHRAPS